MTLMSFQTLIELMIMAWVARFGLVLFKVMDLGSAWGKMLPLFRFAGAALAVGLELTPAQLTPRHGEEARDTALNLVWQGMMNRLLTSPTFHPFGEGCQNLLGVDAGTLVGNLSECFRAPFGQSHPHLMRTPILAFMFGFGIPTDDLNNIFSKVEADPLVWMFALSAALAPHSVEALQKDAWQQEFLPSFSRVSGPHEVHMEGSGEVKNFFLFARRRDP